MAFCIYEPSLPEVWGLKGCQEILRSRGSKQAIPQDTKKLADSLQEKCEVAAANAKSILFLVTHSPEKGLLGVGSSPPASQERAASIQGQTGSPLSIRPASQWHSKCCFMSIFATCSRLSIGNT